MKNYRYFYYHHQYPLYLFQATSAIENLVIYKFTSIYNNFFCIIIGNNNNNNNGNNNNNDNNIIVAVFLTNAKIF